MSILKEFANKYEGVINTQSSEKGDIGEVEYHELVQKGKVNYKGTEIEFWWDGQGGDPFRMMTKIEKTLVRNFTIYPRNYWGMLFCKFIPNWKLSFPKNIHSQYKFSGDKDFIRAIRDNQTVLDLLYNANVCITMKKGGDRIILTPVKGFSKSQHLDQFAELLYNVRKLLDI
jgi:hypothetical protein